MSPSNAPFRTLRGEGGLQDASLGQKKSLISALDFLAPTKEKKDKKEPPKGLKTVKGLELPKKCIDDHSPAPPSPHKAIDVLGPDA